MSSLTVITACSFTYITYQSEKKAFFDGIDGRLYSAAKCARAMLPADYHDRITSGDSMATAEYDTIVDRNNKLCRELGLQYIWSVMLMSNSVVFTTSTSPAKDISKHDYATFFEVHTNPDFFNRVFDTMEVCTESFRNKWGSGRSVLVPYRDSHGRKYCFGASMTTADVNAMLRKSLLRPLLLSLAVLLAGIGASILLAWTLSQPIVRLTSVAREIAAGRFDQTTSVSACTEIASLSSSINAMSAAIRAKLLTISESEERFRRVFNEGLMGIALLALDRKITKANPAFSRITGYSQDELTGLTLSSIMHPDFASLAGDSLEKVIRGETSLYRAENLYLRKDGASIWVSILVSAIRDVAGHPLYLLAMVEDISERKAMEDQLRKSEERFRSLFENMTEGVALHELVLGPDGKPADYRLVDVNPAFEQQTGQKQAQVCGQLASQLHGCSPPPYLEIFAAVAESGRPAHFEMFFAPLKRHFKVGVCSPRKGWFALVFEDITDRKQMYEQLRHNEEKFRTLFENMTEGVALNEIVYDENGKATNYRVIDVNPAFHRQTGILPEQARGRLATELYGTETAPHLAQWARVAETGRPHYSEAQFGPMNRLFSIAACSPRKGWFATVFTDITEKKLTEEKLRKSEEKFRALIETTSDWIWEVDSSGAYTYVSPHIRELLGYEPEEILGRTPMSLMHPSSQPIDRETITRNLASHKPFAHCENTSTHKKGHRVVFETSGVPIQDAEGRFAGFRGIGRDITERKKAEESILQLNRELEQRVKDRTIQLELANRELRTFAYSVSHDLRAPLRSIDGFSKAILEDYSEKLDAEGQDYIHRLCRASQRMSALIDDLLKLSRVTSGEMHVMDINLSHIAENILVDLRKTDRSRNVETIIQPGLTAHADPHLVTVALENLLGNAWKFTSRKPTAKIEFGSLAGDSATVFYVRDNGAGFDMAFVDRLFGAFQRLHTAAEYPGDGIGLASVQRIIHRHGGRIWAEGKPDEGATFYFTLG